MSASHLQPAWAKELPPLYPEFKKRIAEGIILKHISFFETKTARELYYDVINDYGEMSERTLYRHLKKLINTNKVKKLVDDDKYYYIRAGTWTSDYTDHDDDEIDNPPDYAATQAFKSSKK